MISFFFVEYKPSTHLSEAILSRDFLVNQRNLFLDQFYMVLTPSYGSFLLAWHCAGPEIHCTRTTDVFDVNPQRAYSNRYWEREHGASPITSYMLRTIFPWCILCGKSIGIFHASSLFVGCKHREII